MPSSEITKRVFADTLKNLMETTPFTKITIAEITHECGMSRNSFYYHFKDKYELLNWIFLTETTEKINQEGVSDFTSWELLGHICEYFYENKNFYENALEYDGQDSLTDYFRGMMDTLLETRAEELFDQDLESEYYDFCMDYFVDSTTSTIIRWIKDGTRYTPDEFTAKLKKAMIVLATRIVENEELNKI